MESTSNPTPTKYQQVVVDVPEERVAEFHAFFARFLSAPAGRGRRGRYGRRHHGGPHHGRQEGGCGAGRREGSEQAEESEQRERDEQRETATRRAETTEL